LLFFISLKKKEFRYEPKKINSNRGQGTDTTG